MFKLTLILSRVIIMSETEDINITHAQSPRSLIPQPNSFIRKSVFKTSRRPPEFHWLLDCMSLATLDSPCFSGLVVPK